MKLEVDVNSGHHRSVKALIDLGAAQGGNFSSDRLKLLTQFQSKRLSTDQLNNNLDMVVSPQSVQFSQPGIAEQIEDMGVSSRV